MWLGYAILLVATAVVVDTAKVLFMPSTLYPMHSYTMKHLADELVQRKHDVTWLEYGPVQVNHILLTFVSQFSLKILCRIRIRTEGFELATGLAIVFLAFFSLGQLEGRLSLLRAPSCSNGL